MKFCTHCGTSLHEGDIFCTNCGHRIESAGSEPSAAASAASVPDEPLPVVSVPPAEGVATTASADGGKLPVPEAGTADNTAYETAKNLLLQKVALPDYEQALALLAQDDGSKAADDINMLRLLGQLYRTIDTLYTIYGKD